jgi:hypothetical protein
MRHRTANLLLGSSTPKIPSHVVLMLKGHLEKGLLVKGFAGEQPRKLALRVDVKDYRDRGAVTRFMLGALAGSDNMESTVEVVDLRDNRTVATSTDTSYNTTAIGDMDVQGVLMPGGSN